MLGHFPGSGGDVVASETPSLPSLLTSAPAGAMLQTLL